MGAFFVSCMICFFVPDNNEENKGGYPMNQDMNEGEDYSYIPATSVASVWE
ncbi:hypothetical protein JCM19046_3403 [Bacillus sp. JCM 19046]|nr:hypothetical protein JCM19046_3403 [Bacillus sp. JCM 19046]